MNSRQMRRLLTNVLILLSLFAALTQVRSQSDAADLVVEDGDQIAEPTAAEPAQQTGEAIEPMAPRPVKEDPAIPALFEFLKKHEVDTSKVRSRTRRGEVAVC